MLAEGERVPADARLLLTDDLQVNESSLTGESNPAHKSIKAIEKKVQVYEQKNMLFQGTFVISGTATAVVVATGSQTEFGKIAALATEENSRSSLQVKIDKLITLIVKALQSLLCSFLRCRCCAVCQLMKHCDLCCR